MASKRDSTEPIGSTADIPVPNPTILRQVTPADGFLINHNDRRPFSIPKAFSTEFKPVAFLLGKGRNSPLEVAIVSCEKRPSANQFRSLWKTRHGAQPSPLLLIGIYTESQRQHVVLCGPIGDEPQVALDVDPRQAERIAIAALNEPNQHAAIRLLRSHLAHGTRELHGIRNVGMFAMHELRFGVRSRSDWMENCERGRNLQTKRGRNLIEGLGYTIDSRGPAAILRSKGNAAAVAILLDAEDIPELRSEKFNNLSPISHCMSIADSESLRFVVITRGSDIRIHSTSSECGVGRKGRTETFFEVNLDLLPEESAGYIPLVFGPDALAKNGSFEEILERSYDFATDLGERLRERIYREVVPALVSSLSRTAKAKDLQNPEVLSQLYDQAMIILFRLLFIAYAEDRDLLPYRSNAQYQRHSLKALARSYSDRLNKQNLEFDKNATDQWHEIKSLWRAIDKGHREWGVPAYNGGLFSTDPQFRSVGAKVEDIELTNAEIGTALVALLVDRSQESQYGPVDFRSLSVREFGTIYEGLLESSLSVAPCDLSVDKNGVYSPSKSSEEASIKKGQIYLHNQSGIRKSTGSYFTKPFAVEHLLDNALEPQLDKHVERLQALIDQKKTDEAAAIFFDFKIVDLAMGSGHFLSGAVDRIEVRLSSFLSKNKLEGVLHELDRLHLKALEHLGPLAESMDIDNASLIRRQVARRCVYGVDRNEIAVELARLALWIHTFVPGLPLSFLSHNLVCGDSLVGIGAVEEALSELDPGAVAGPMQKTLSIFGNSILKTLSKANQQLIELSAAAEMTAAEITLARKVHRDALKTVEPLRDLFDLLVAVRTGHAKALDVVSEETVAEHKDLKKAQTIARSLKMIHLPIVFPEVFSRERPGFDCIIGNPPWEEATVEKLAFWAARFPGLKSMRGEAQKKAIKKFERDRQDLAADYELEVERAEQTRKILLKGPFPGMGTGDPDLYKAFSWRFWQACRVGGSVGVVLPRSALAANGSELWRTEVFEKGQFSDVTFLVNNRQWIFDDLHPQYTVGLVTIVKERRVETVSFRGPFTNLNEFRDGRLGPATTIPTNEFRSWTPAGAFPLLPTKMSTEIFLQLRTHPRIDDKKQPWLVRAVRELDATNDKGEMDFKPKSTQGMIPVYKGESIDIWSSDSGIYYAWAERTHIKNFLFNKRLRQQRDVRSAFSLCEPDWVRKISTLSCNHPRIAFRDVTRATDTRTVRAALVPSGVVIGNQAPYLLRIKGDERDEAFLLGVLSSIPLDWYARRIVENHLNFHIFYTLPIPLVDRNDPVRRRVEEIAARLTSVDRRFATWAGLVGVTQKKLEVDERQSLIAELDASVAFLFGLTSDQIAHLFETFHIGWNFKSHLNMTSQYFKNLVDSRG